MSFSALLFTSIGVILKHEKENPLNHMFLLIRVGICVSVRDRFFHRAVHVAE